MTNPHRPRERDGGARRGRRRCQRDGCGTWRTGRHVPHPHCQSGRQRRATAARARACRDRGCRSRVRARRLGQQGSGASCSARACPPRGCRALDRRRSQALPAACRGPVVVRSLVAPPRTTRSRSMRSHPKPTTRRPPRRRRAGPPTRPAALGPVARGPDDAREGRPRSRASQQPARRLRDRTASLARSWPETRSRR